MESSTPAEVRERADAVFRGTIREFDAPTYLNWLPAPLAALLSKIYEPHITIEFEVVEAWKGVNTRTVEINFENLICNGQPPLEIGLELLVFARREPEDSSLWSESCLRPIRVEDEWAQAALAELGPGRRDLPPPVPLGPVYAGLLALMVALFGWWWSKRCPPVPRD